MAIRFDRLLNVCRALDEARDTLFDMSTFIHRCGTPACALGHYGAREDLQQEYSILDNELLFNGSSYPMTDGGPQHFGLDDTQSVELFGSDGCGFAKTRQEASRYIREFVLRQGGSISRPRGYRPPVGIHYGKQGERK